MTRISCDIITNMKKTIFEFDTYIEFLKAKMKENSENWGLITKMAAAAGCQRSQLSRAVNEQVLLTLEQADGLCDFWNLSEIESDYFILLVELARAGSKRLKQRFLRKLKKIRNEQEDLSQRLNQASLGANEKEVVYYSAWYWSAIHILVSIPQFRTTTAIAARLSLPISLVQYCLENLERFELISKEGAGWSFSSQTIHLPRRSPLIGIHHNNWRSRAMLASQNPLDDGIHYTVVQSVSMADYEKIKHQLLATIDEYTKIAGPSREEELICFSCDTFRV